MAFACRCARAALLLTLSTAGTSMAAPAGPARAYIEATHVVAPEQVGEFSLERASFDPKAKYSGAGFTYESDDQPRPVISVYVYPAGQMTQDAALRDGMAAFREDLRLAQEAGTYGDLEIVDADAFPLSGTGEVAEDAKGTPADAELLAIIAKASRIDGQHLGLRMRLPGQDVDIQSAGFLFYKQLYYFKVRISVAADAMPPDAFKAFADRAARILVPAIQAVNIGACANATITLPSDGSPEEAGGILVREATLHQGYNCHASRTDAKLEALSRGARVIEIGYSAAEWKSE
ncbi:MAG: hypothetical protein RR792_03035 [Thermomonas sp.]